MLNASLFLPRLIGRQRSSTTLGAQTVVMATCSPFADSRFRTKETGVTGIILPRVFLWAYEGELSAKRNNLWW